MKATRILMAALLLAGCLASCSKDNDNDGESMPTFETLHGYMGRTDIDAIAAEFRQAGYEVSTKDDEPEMFIYAIKGQSEEDGRGYWIAAANRNDALTVYGAEYMELSANALRKETLLKVLDDQKQFCAGMQKSGEVYEGSIRLNRNEDSQRFGSAEELIAALNGIESIASVRSSYNYADGTFATLRWNPDEGIEYGLTSDSKLYK